MCVERALPSLLACTQLQSVTVLSTLEYLAPGTAIVWLEAVDVLRTLPPQLPRLTFRTTVFHLQPVQIGNLALSWASTLKWSKIGEALRHCKELEEVEIVLNMSRCYGASATFAESEAELRDAVREKLSPRLQSLVKVVVEW